MLPLRSWRSDQLQGWFKCSPEVGVTLLDSMTNSVEDLVKHKRFTSHVIYLPSIVLWLVGHSVQIVAVWFLNMPPKCLHPSKCKQSHLRRTIAQRSFVRHTLKHLTFLMKCVFRLIVLSLLRKTIFFTQISFTHPINDCKQPLITCTNITMILISLFVFSFVR